MPDWPPMLDPFNRSRLPEGFTREHRVELLAEVFRALIEGRQPSRAAALFVGGAGAAWLSQGGDLLRDYWRVAAPRSSHNTPTRVWRELCSSRGATGAEQAETIDADDDLEGSA